MFCKSCGKKIDDDSKYCIHCGTELFSNEMPESVNHENRIELPVSPKMKNQDAFFLTPKRPDHFSETSFNEKEKDLKKIETTLISGMPMRAIVGVLLSFIGCFFLSSVVSFSILSIRPITIDNYIGIGGITKNLLIVYCLIILIISSFLLSKNRLILKKIISISIDSLALFLCLYISELFLIDKGVSSENLVSYPPFYNTFINKLTVWSLFFLIYYLLGELSGGTIGKRIAGLISRNHEKQKISVKQGIQKVSIYSIPIWMMLISFILNPEILNNINNSMVYHFCQWLFFILFFVSLFMIFISKENYSLADFFSKTVVEKDNNQIFSTNITNESQGSSDVPFENISSLHKLIVSEKRKVFSGSNKLIIERIEEIVKDTKSFFSLNKMYKELYSNDLIEHLKSISSSYGTIYYYMKPFIKLGLCEEDFPHKIISSD